MQESDAELHPPSYNCCQYRFCFIASSPKSTLKDNYRLVMASLLSFICTCVYHIRAGVLPWLLVHIVSYAVVVLLLSYTGQDNISVCNFTVDQYCYSVRAYAQQGYEFGHVGLCTYMYVRICIYICRQKKQAV